MSKKILIGVLAGVVAVGAGAAAIGTAVSNNSSDNSGNGTASVGNASSADDNGSDSDNTEASGGGTQQNNAAASAKVEELGLHNPRDPETEKVSFSYVYFGSYPQTEIAAEKTKETKADVDPGLFSKLQAATDWDSNNDIVIDGVKYRRCNGDYVYKSRTTYVRPDSISLSEEHDYKWFSDDDPDTYHYFRYEPVKWKVFEVNDDNLLLTSDKILDLSTYGDNRVQVIDGEYVKNSADSWKTSRIRSFLNGLGADENVVKENYSDKGMLQLMFTSEESSYLIPIESDAGTKDLLTVPSVEDYSGDLGYAHGFAKKKKAENTRRKSFTTDFGGTSYESSILRNEPKNDVINIASVDGTITTLFQSYGLGVLPMARVSLNCPYLQKAEAEEY